MDAMSVTECGEVRRAVRMAYAMHYLNPMNEQLSNFLSRLSSACWDYSSLNTAQPLSKACKNNLIFYITPTQPSPLRDVARIGFLQRRVPGRVLPPGGGVPDEKEGATGEVASHLHRGI